VESLCRTLGFDKCFAVSSSGRSGGLGLFWNNEIKVDILPYSQYHLDTIVTEQGKESWRLTVVYGEAQVNERHKTWDMLKFIRSANDLPWLCIGDFNEVLHRSEHMGVNERSYSQMAGFRDAVDVCGLCDLGFSGVEWTFEKKVAGGSFCRTRLDRALASPAWCTRFPAAEVQHLATAATTDHLPILLRWLPVEGKRRRRDPKLFRYEVAWESHKDFPEMLRENCTTGGPSLTMDELQHKLTDVSSGLARWGRQSFGNIQMQIRTMQGELRDMRSDPNRACPSPREQEIARKLAELLDQEEVMWRQRSRVQWLAAGDKNTKFFHLRASQRRKKNKVSELLRSDGTSETRDEELGNMAKEFYKDLYMSEGVHGMDEVLNKVPVKVSSNMNQMLDRPFDMTEVKTALF
jgi:hypothetical protein